MKKILLLFTIVLGGIYFYNKESPNQKISNVLEEWIGHKIIYPDNLLFYTINGDTLQYDLFNSLYKIVTYTDSMGCISCKLQLPKWKKMIKVFHEEKLDVSVLFFMSPKDKEYMNIILRDYDFTYPVCVDVEDRFGSINKFPKDEIFHTFLLDKDNKVIAIGNPINNPQVKELYLKIIRGEKVNSTNNKKIVNTEVRIDKTFLNLGRFDWKQKQKSIFTLTNKGTQILMIQDVITSCSCTTVDYPQKPILPGKKVILTVTYKAEHPEHFNKTIIVHCNTESSPIKLTISGNAE